ncbi:MAG: rhamnogalacturonan acetylesterase [Bacteroidales bacterium]|nr:rhamnogalacturonan acetylesterase [Bacteroidales bacterium]
MKNTLIFVFTVIVTISCNAQEKSNDIHLKFNFGTKNSDKDYINIDTNTIYTNESGYGFDYNTIPELISRKSTDTIESEFCTSTGSFFFSAKLPEGNYNVTLTLGDIEGESLTTVKAESRRLMLEKIKTGKGEIKKVTFTVNVRTPKINDTLSIKLKSREHKYLNWDNKLTIEFTDEHPCVCAVEIEKIKPELVVYLTGNSTVTDQYTEPWASWGQMITRFFQPGIAVANYAESGESLHSSYYSYRLEKVLSVIQPGDYLFIEFGHNDQKRKGEGIGPWESYSDYLRLYIDKAREKGAIPVLVTSMRRRRFDENGQQYNSLGDYPDAMRAIAKEKEVALIDLNNMSKVLYDAWGMEGSKKGFVHYPANTYPNQPEALADDTHFNNYGAYNLALCILKGIQDDNLGLAKYIIDFPANFNPAHPIPFEDWKLPESPPAENEVPEGS